VKYRFITLIIFTVFISACSTFTISKEELVQQLEENQKRKEVSQYIPIGGASIFYSNNFQSNQIEKILCYDSDSNKVYLFINKDTQLEITKISDGDVVKIYFNTAFLVEDKIVGLRSRLIQSMVREVLVNDIVKIEITTEMSSTEPYVD
jgi:hypothetical protein